MLLLCSLDVECELLEEWAKWELSEGKMILMGEPPSSVWLWFSMVHYQGHLSDFSTTVVLLSVCPFPCKEVLIFTFLLF